MADPEGRPVPYSPSQRGTALSHTTLPSFRMQEMVCEPWVLTKPSSHRNETELPSWRLSPKRFPLTGTPGSGHSLWRNAIGNVAKSKIYKGQIIVNFCHYRDAQSSYLSQGRTNQNICLIDLILLWSELQTERMRVCLRFEPKTFWL